MNKKADVCMDVPKMDTFSPTMSGTEEAFLVALADRICFVLHELFDGNKSRMAAACEMPYASLYRTLQVSAVSSQATQSKRLRLLADTLVRRVGVRRDFLERGQLPILEETSGWLVAEPRRAYLQENDL